MRRFITECHLGHWSAWELQHPEVAFGGNSPAVALGRLLDSLGLEHQSIEVGEVQRVERMEFVIRDKVCPDCRGNGEYVGLREVATCEACGGSGRM